MQNPTPDFEVFLRRVLSLALWVSLLLALAGISFKILQLPFANELLITGLASLACVYFLMAFTLPQIPAGIQPFIYSTIVYKVLYIASSVTTMGVLFRLLHLEGSHQMLMIGMLTLGAGCLVAALFFLLKSDNWILLKEAFIRAITLLLLAVVILRNVS
jgi:hypothetical protein